MDSKKIIYIASGFVVFLLTLMGIVVFMSISGGSDGKMTKGLDATVENYLNDLNKGKIAEAYQKLSSDAQGIISLNDYTELNTIMLNEEGARYEVDDTKKVEKVNIKTSSGEEIACTNVPILRVYQISTDGVKQTVKDEMVLSTIKDSEGKYKIYYTKDKLNGYVQDYVLAKANRSAVEALQYKNSEDIVSKNVQIIDDCIKYAKKVPSSYAEYNNILLEINLLTGYKFLAQGDEKNALVAIKSSYEYATTKQNKTRIKTVEAELYISVGDYASAVEVLSEALEIDPDDLNVRKDYRRVSSMMIGLIESSLSRGWSQLESGIKQEESEMKRILSDIALVEANNAIKLNEGAPDGYYLRGNIYYCLGKYNDAISSLEKAIEVSKSEDTIFRTKVAEILGMARIASASKDVVFDADSYKRVLDSEIRSYLFRESEVGGFVDSIN